MSSVVLPAVPDLVCRILYCMAPQQNYSLYLQDRVVSLQALAQYAALIAQEIRDIKVPVKGKDASPLEFHGPRNNKLVLHQLSLLAVLGLYTVQVTGSCCVYVQVSIYKEQSCQVLPLTIQVGFGLKQALQPQILSKIWLSRQNHVKKELRYTLLTWLYCCLVPKSRVIVKRSVDLKSGVMRYITVPASIWNIYC